MVAAQQSPKRVSNPHSFPCRPLHAAAPDLEDGWYFAPSYMSDFALADGLEDLSMFLVRWHPYVLV